MHSRTDFRVMSDLGDDNDAWLSQELLATEQAVAPVRLDLARTCDLAVDVRIVVEDGHPRVWVNNGQAWEGVELADPQGAVARAADYVQEQLMDVGVDAFWPTCPTHDRGLHAEVRDGHAVWWCRGGRHSLGAVGELQLASET